MINASAARVWELCDGRPVDELLDAFGEPYGLAPEAVRPNGAAGRSDGSVARY